MPKIVVQTPEAENFAATLTTAAFRRYVLALDVLREVGYLRAPVAEKVEGHRNLFAIRIRTDGNSRFFYCYDDGVHVYILNGYEKKTDRIPLREIALAEEIKRRFENVD